MKFAKLLVLSTLWLSAGSAMAAIVDGVRQKPAPSKTQGFVASETKEDSYYYLYNVDAKAFFTEGNAWGTQVSIGDTGLKVAFTPDGAYELAYLFNDFSVSKNSWKLVFFDSEDQMYVDWNSQANYRWGVQANGDTFRLYAASEEQGNPGWASTVDEETGEETPHPAYREGLYMGWDAASSSTACVPYLAEGEGHCINWAFVTKEVYEDYTAEYTVYEAAEALRLAISDAESKGFTATADYKTVYANEAATLEELNKAVTDLNDAFMEWAKNLATVENPADMTAMIKNPDFKNDNLTTGWSGDAFGSYNPKENAEHYNKTYNTYQKISGLAAGVYAVGVKAFYRAGNAQSAWDNYKAGNAASKYAKLYATAGETTRESAIVSPCIAMLTQYDGTGSTSTCTDTDEEGNETTYIIPNNMEAAEYYMHTLGLYANKVLIAVSEGEDLTIGVKKETTISGDWSIFDDFSLTFYGNAAEAYQFYLDDALKNYGDVTIEEGTVYTESYLTAYQEALKGELKATNAAEVDTAMEAVESTYAALQKNIELWDTWQNAVEDAYNKYVTNEVYELCESVGYLSDYCEMDDNGDGGPGKETILAEHKLTNEELEAEIERVNAWELAILDEAKNTVKDGDDVTRFIVNPGFDDDKDIDSSMAEGWTIDNNGGGNVVRGPLGSANKSLMEQSLGTMNYCFEAWHSTDFDVWQELSDLPKGMYQLDVQGYVRYEGELSGNGDTAINIWNSMNNVWNPNSPEIPESPISLYMNSAQSKFPNIFSEPKPEDKEYVVVEDWTYNTDGSGNVWPNSMGGAAQAFAWGLYKSTAYGLIAKKGDKFRIGVKGQTDKGWWCIFDSFKLTYRTPTPDVVRPILEAEIAKIDLTAAMGSDVYEQAVKVKGDAEAAVASQEGDAMFDALIAVYEAQEAINSSTALFTTLENYVGDLRAAISGAVSAEATKSEARTLADNIESGMENHTYANDDVEGLIADINLMITKLGIPAGYENATDDAPADFTSTIKNASYDEGISGWSGTTAAWSSDGCNAEIFGKNYDYYQDIECLPAGTYEVKVQAFYRAGLADTDYNTWLESPEENNNAFLYASSCGESDTITSSKPLVRLAAEAGSVYYGTDGYVTVKEATDEAEGLAVCNSMTTAGYEFMDEKYQNSLIVKLAEGATLRIGLKKIVDLTDNWSIWDNWKLTYYGTNSAKAADNDLMGINSLTQGDTFKVEYFNLNGARISGPQKGIVLMKQTMSDGSVKVRKVAIK